MLILRIRFYLISSINNESNVSIVSHKQDKQHESCNTKNNLF